MPTFLSLANDARGYKGFIAPEEAVEINGDLVAVNQDK